MNSSFYKIILLVSITLVVRSGFAQSIPKYEFGLKATLNYSTIGSRYSQYSGAGQYGLGLFATRKLSPRLIASVEPAISANSFRQTQIDQRYRYTYADAGLNLFYDLFNNEAIFIYGGLRPAYLLSYRSEVMQAGAYVKDNNAILKNKEGQVDVGINAGVSLRLSKVISLDMGYMWSATNATNMAQADGRPSLFEVSLKLNAVDLKNVVEQRDEMTTEQIKTYKRGAVLVMLQTYNEKDMASIGNLTDYLSKPGQDLANAKIKALDLKQLLVNDLVVLNKHIMNEFKQSFSFSPVYFFMDTSVNKVLLGETNGIFVNENLETDPNIMLKEPGNFFVAAFATDLSASTQKINYGMYLYDQKMQQLPKPFNMNSQVMSVYFDLKPTAALADMMKVAKSLVSVNVPVTETNILNTRKLIFEGMPFRKNIKKLNDRLERYNALD